MLWLPLVLFPVVVSVVLIGMCAKTDDRKKERRERNERSHDSTSSDRGVFDDRLEEISENMAFHVIAKSNKERRKERTINSAARSTENSKNSATNTRLGRSKASDSESSSV